MFYDVCVHKSDRLDVRLLDVQCTFRMKTSERKDEQLERRTLIHECSTFLCQCIVKRPTTYVLRMFIPFKAFV